jgi:transglutaminase-like putative cysteine protease
MHKRLIPVAAAMLCILPALTASAQNAEVSEAAARYKGEQAITWNHSEKLSLQFEDGRLVGHSDISREVLLLTDRAASQYATDEVYHGFQRALTSIEAATLVPSGSRYKAVRATAYRTSYASERNIFYNDMKQTEVSFASLGRFARTRLDYSLVYHDVHYLPPFYFQSPIPQREVSLELRVPRGVKIGYRLSGLHQSQIHLSKDERRNETIYTWTANDMPAAKQYDNAPSYAWYVPQLSVFVTSFDDPKTSATTPLLGTVDALYRWYYGFIKNVKLTPDAGMKSLVDSLTKGLSNPRAKAGRIYHWVQDHVRYVAYEDSLGGYVPRDAPLVCSRRFGDCKDMSSLLVTLSRYAGIDAHLAWIGTRDIPYRYEELPTPMNDNHMICMARIDGKWLYMDGTDRDIVFGFPPSMIQDKEALVSIDATHFEVVKTPITPAVQNLTSDTTELELDGNDAAGRISVRLQGYPAWDAAALMRYTSERDRDKVLGKLSNRGSGRYELGNPRFEADAGGLKPCSISGHVSLPGLACKAGDELYVNLNLQRDFEDDYADGKEREAPISYDYLQSLRKVVMLKIPAGYKLSYLPPDKADGAPGLWNYKFHYEQRGGSIVLSREITTNTLSVAPADFSAHNRLVEGLRDAYKESVVLTKTK